MLGSWSFLLTLLLNHYNAETVMFCKNYANTMAADGSLISNHGIDYVG